MSYLLGFPTPVIEVLLILIVLFLVVSVYLGTQMEGTEPVRDHESLDGIDSSEVND
ncbi:hypothetical protein HYG81_24790 (plasmid) [Natrinema zhouii]|uniref:hypothetical protein n=1 Tax=Natrinema zhouii TaxID=1710539 RepID=UPI001CFFBA93|nr:hypothetical protein [Natrinema zhouii]UHQ98975.1 hypothetical protein HYG81_24790 [Natrinema zhouii]